MPNSRPARRKMASAAVGAVDELARYLRTETVGGLVMLGAAVLALGWVNSPLAGSYLTLREVTVGPAAVHLDLDLATWAADGLLAVFFFVAGLELKRELVLGELRDRRTAMLPVLAALGGVVVPAVIAVVVMRGTAGAERAWAIPVATDIAFALAVLAVVGSTLPRAMRVFLLSQAVVDDLVAIALIAVLFTAGASWWALLAAVVALGAYGLAQRARIRTPWLYVPLALVTWAAVHESGVHATIAGVGLALLTRVHADEGEAEAPAARLEHRLQPWSAGLCVPVFAFFASGVVITGSGLAGAVQDRITLGIAAGLLVGKVVGVSGGAWLAVRLRLATLPGDLGWRDIRAVSVLAGVGFTVSLLIAELSFDAVADVDRARTAVLLSSAVAAVLGGLLLRRRAVHHSSP